MIMKNISLLDRIWNLWLIRFAHSPPNFIFWLGRLIFSVLINSHPDNIYTYHFMKTLSFWILFESFVILIIFLKSLNLIFLFFFVENFKICRKFWNFDLFCILPWVPDYCASLQSQIPPVTLYWFPVASFPVQITAHPYGVKFLQ